MSIQINLSDEAVTAIRELLQKEVKRLYRNIERFPLSLAEHRRQWREKVEFLDGLAENLFDRGEEGEQ